MAKDSSESALRTTENGLKSRSLLEKCLFLVVAVLVAIIIVLGFLFLFHVGQKNEGEEYCLSEDCITSAAQIISSLDKTVNPCDDFYQYACGGWIKKNPIPDGQSIWNNFNKVMELNQFVVKNGLQRPVSEMKSEAEKKAKYFYLSCMDPNNTIETLGSVPMLKFLDDVGGWSVSGRTFNITTWSLQNTLQTLQNRYNMGGLFAWGVTPDDHNSSLNTITVDQGPLLLPSREYYLNVTRYGKVLDALLDLMTEIGVLLGGDYNQTITQMKNVIDFETKLATITKPDDQRRDPEKLYHQMTIAQLQNIAPFISWIDYFTDAFQQVGKNITSEEFVVVYAPEYLSNLTNIIQNYTSTNDGKIIVNNYLILHTAKILTPLLSKPFREAFKGLKKALTGTDGELEKWRICVGNTNMKIGFATAAMYVKDTFNGDSKSMSEDMVKRIKAAFKENLRGLSWMDKETIAVAEDKVDYISTMIGYPDYILDDKKIDEKYKDLEVNESTYFENIINANQFHLKKNLQDLGMPVDKTRWELVPQDVNAYYSPTKNQIVLLAGILQSPFFSKSYPHSLNFGGIGMVVGHEITHGFDDQGRQYDKYGNIHQWWNNNTIAKFTKRAECLIEQYSNYSINGQNLNGRNTLGENIADNGGIKAAFKIYQNWAKSNKIDLPLPGLNLTHKQLVFLSFAQGFCSSSTEESMTLAIATDPHSPSKFRVIGSLSNFPEFAKEFNCPLGSKMNPVNKCEIW